MKKSELWFVPAHISPGQILVDGAVLEYARPVILDGNFAHAAMEEDLRPVVVVSEWPQTTVLVS